MIGGGKVKKKRKIGREGRKVQATVEMCNRDDQRRKKKHGSEEMKRRRW